MKAQIFIASYNRPHFLDPCLEALSKYDSSKYEIYIYDNKSNNETFKVYGKYSEIKYFKYHFGEENIGKAKAINYLFNKYNKPDTIMISMDSDIVMQEACMDELVFMANSRKTLVAPEYVGHNCHLYRGKRVQEHLIVVPGCIGICGGVLAMPAYMFKYIGGYNESMGIYGGNEKGLYEKFGRSRKGYVLTNTFAYHPRETDTAYQQWKDKCQNDIRSFGFTGSSSYEA